MDEDQILQSIIADPQLTDPSIDVGQLRQTTPTRTELLADVPEFSGLKFDPTQRSYIEDLYTLYGGGAPMLPEPVVDTPVVDTTPIVDTSAMDQPAGDSILDTTPTGGLTESGTFAGQPTFTTTPGTTVDSVTGDITNPDGSYGGNIVDEVALTGAAPSGITGDPIDVGIPDNESGFVDPLGTISGAPVVGDFSEPTTGTISDDRLNEVIDGQPMAAGPFDYLQEQTPISQVTVGTGLSQTEKDKLAGYTPSFETPEQQEGFLQNVLGKAGQTVEGALNELGKVPGAVVDFANQTVDVFGQKLNVGKTLAAAAINKLAGGPISLVFELLPSEDPANTLTRSIVDELKASGKDYGFNIQSGNLNQDPFGRNPVSAFGNYEQTLLDDLTSTKTTKMAEKKKEFAQDYFDKKTTKTAPQEDIGSIPSDDTTGVDPVTGDLPGGGNIVDEFAPSDIQPTDPSLDIPDRGRGDQSGGDSGVAPGTGAAGPAGGATMSGPSDNTPRGGGADMGTVGAGIDTSGDFAGKGTGASGPAGGGGGGGGGGKIVCTMMNESYGFGSFRNKIWLRHSKDLAPEYQIGYHKIFLPLVKLSKTNKILKKTLEHIAVHRTIDIRQESRGKVHLLGRVYRKILEPICYWVGKYAKR